MFTVWGNCRACLSFFSTAQHCQLCLCQSLVRLWPLLSSSSAVHHLHVSQRHHRLQQSCDKVSSNSVQDAVCHRPLQCDSKYSPPSILQGKGDSPTYSWIQTSAPLLCKFWHNLYGFCTLHSGPKTSHPNHSNSPNPELIT